MGSSTSGKQLPIPTLTTTYLPHEEAVPVDQDKPLLDCVTQLLQVCLLT